MLTTICEQQSCREQHWHNMRGKLKKVIGTSKVIDWLIYD